MKVTILVSTILLSSFAAHATATVCHPPRPVARTAAAMDKACAMAVKSRMEAVEKAANEQSAKIFKVSRVRSVGVDHERFACLVLGRMDPGVTNYEPAFTTRLRYDNVGDDGLSEDPTVYAEGRIVHHVDPGGTKVKRCSKN